MRYHSATMSKLIFSGVVACLIASHPTSAKDDFICPGPGLWADPDDCSCFYNCANDIPYPGCCDQGEFWDQDLHICNYEDQVDCGDRPSPDHSTVPPTPGPSTTQGPTTTVDPNHPGFPSKVLGMYILLADKFNEGFEDDADWEPLLYPYQQEGANVLFFTFIDPSTMVVPKAFQKLASTRGSDTEGAVPADTLIIFAIGGYAYSLDPDPWDWLTTREKAEAMAEQVAAWRDDYGIDGIDLDIEDGAGTRPEAGPNMVHFTRKIKEIHPDMIVSQPTYGYPQVPAEIDEINASWNKGGSSNSLADSIGIMVYEGTQSLNYVENYAEGSDMFGPIKCDVPKQKILVGCYGAASSSTIMQLAEASVSQNLLGVMAWYCSVQNGMVYEEEWDCSSSMDAKEGYIKAMQYLKQHQ